MKSLVLSANFISYSLCLFAIGGMIQAKEYHTLPYPAGIALCAFSLMAIYMRHPTRKK
jgi:hypothetical protein